MEAIGRPGSTIGRLGRRTTVLLACRRARRRVQQRGRRRHDDESARDPDARRDHRGDARRPAAAPADLTLELANDAELGDYVAGADGHGAVRLPARRGRHERVQRRVRGQLAAADRATSPPAQGVTGELGTITRDDGTHAGHARRRAALLLHRRRGGGRRERPGPSDVWYLASAEGTPVGAEDEPPAEETPCAGRYCY